MLSVWSRRQEQQAENAWMWTVVQIYNAYDWKSVRSQKADEYPRFGSGYDPCSYMGMTQSLRIKYFSLESWVNLNRKMGKHIQAWVNLNRYLGNQLESWVESESIPGKPLKSWFESIEVFEILLESWANSNQGTWVECPKKGHTNASLEWKPQKVQRALVEARKRSTKLSESQKSATKSTVVSNHWVMNWFESIFQIVFESWVDLI